MSQNVPPPYLLEGSAMAMRSLVLLTVLAALLLHQVNGKDPWNRATMSVRIRNELPGVLAVHCKSRDDDLGQQYLPAGGTPGYYFSFKDNFWSSTLFWCRFSYGPVLWNAFEVWKGPGLFSNKKMPCEQCVWAARADAFYRAQEGPDSVFTAVYPWRSDHQSHPQNVSDMRN
jgi:hypothetical protein